MPMAPKTPAFMTTTGSFVVRYLSPSVAGSTLEEMTIEPEARISQRRIFPIVDQGHEEVELVEQETFEDRVAAQGVVGVSDDEEDMRGAGWPHRRHLAVSPGVRRPLRQVRLCRPSARGPAGAGVLSAAQAAREKLDARPSQKRAWRVRALMEASISKN